MWVEYLEWIEEVVRTHNSAQSKRISLIASGNAISGRIRQLMDSDLVNRAAEGRPSSSVFPGLEAYYEFEQSAESRVSGAFDAGFAEIRPISGTQANHIVLQAFSKLNSVIAATKIKDGSHVSVAGRITRDMRGLQFVSLPLETDSLRIDIERACEVIRDSQPHVVFLGGSLLIEAQALDHLAEIAHAADATVCFDASHVAGLIATGCFRNPLKDGIDLLSMTTCKTIPGPSHAWIVGKHSYEDQIRSCIFPGHVSGGHLQESVGAVAALAEMLASPVNYGVAVVDIARTFGESLEDNGIRILRTSSGTVTDTHQVVAWPPQGISAAKAVEILSECNILANTTLLPATLAGPGEGLRFGTQELAWRGGSKSIAHELGSLVADSLLFRRDRAVITQRVLELATNNLAVVGKLWRSHAKGS